MAVFRWGQAWDAFRDLEREMDRLLAQVDFTFQGLRSGRQFPPINVYDVDDELLITAELPGVALADLELTIANGVLTIRGRKNGPADVPDEQFRRQERLRGKWERSLTIPERIKEEELAAELNDGLLTIHLPKADRERPRQIPVDDGTDAVKPRLATIEQTPEDEVDPNDQSVAD